MHEGTEPGDTRDPTGAAAAALWRQEQALMQGLSHDLRAPLRAIDSFAMLLAQHPGGLDDAVGRDYLQRIRDAATRMGTLIEALQEYSSASRANLRWQDVDLSLLADWSAAELQDAAPQRSARIDVAPGLEVQGDEHYLKRMLTQLLDNAWKFSASREQVEIAVEGERVGDMLELRVRDQGIGFDTRYADKLFQPFQRLHGTEQGAGHGLGLAIAQCIAQRHGGKIRAESEVEGGSVFHITLPVAQQPRAGAQATETPHNG
jgi:signal transduction histidine kinase